MAKEGNAVLFAETGSLSLLPVHLATSATTNLLAQLKAHGADVAKSIADADIVLTDARSAKRVDAEYRRLKRVAVQKAERAATDSQAESRKRPFTQLSGQATDSDSDHEVYLSAEEGWISQPIKESSVALLVSINWAYDSLQDQELRPLRSYIIRGHEEQQSSPVTDFTTPTIEEVDSEDSDMRSDDENGTHWAATTASQRQSQSSRYSDRPDRPETAGGQPFSLRKRKYFAKSRFEDSQDPVRKTILRRSTSSFEDEENVAIPDPPDWVKQKLLFACQRVTPKHTPNEDFISQLEKIKEARLLEGDEIGVRAYSTSIAALRAYPYPLHSIKQIISLPGCEAKIALLFQEWKRNGRLTVVEDYDKDEAMQVLRLFYNIWGVGATTAREFYYQKGWKDLDDVVEYGWRLLSRVQQIGTKYYDDFLLKITRDEVAEIAKTIYDTTEKICPGIQYEIVGGYRRGNTALGDVDVLMSHPEEQKTMNLIERIVEALEKDNLVSHTLKLHLTNSKRNQQPGGLKSPLKSGAGFDTLDKALLVWERETPNGTIRRRVDIIISPWKTVGCALLGWSGGNTFQRDLRRYSRKVKNWRFDSSGLRDRATGRFMDVEGPHGVSGSMVDAEKAVFKGLGLEYREPWERCTG